MNSTKKLKPFWIVRNKYLGLLFMMCVFCFSISILRAFKTGTTTYLFLNWNLFLAGIPILLSTLMVDMDARNAGARQLPFLFFGWLIFFPNAPYILTDFFHFRDRMVMPMWFDLGILIAFSWTGMLMGLKSLHDIELIIRKRFSDLKSSLLIILILFMSSFGVYLGRIVRWNSWDAITEPVNVFTDIMARVIFPMDHPRAWGMTILYGIILNMIYWSIRLMGFKDRKDTLFTYPWSEEMKRGILAS